MFFTLTIQVVFMKGKSRILLFDWWFEEFDPSTYLEDDLEKTIISRAEIVFPDYYMLPFTKIVEYNGETSKPDLCLIKKDYSVWYIIEVELAKKSFEGHTEKQVRVFSRGNYNTMAKEIAQYLVKKNSKLEEDKLEKLVREEQPSVLVMVSEYPLWAEEVKKYPRTGLLIFGMYDYSDGSEAYRIDGEFPLTPIERSRCKFPKYPANMLEILAPALLNINVGETMVIFYDGRKTIWERLDIGRTVYLLPFAHNPLDVKKKYLLQKTEDDTFFITEN